MKPPRRMKPRSFGGQFVHNPRCRIVTDALRPHSDRGVGESNRTGQSTRGKTPGVGLGAVNSGYSGGIAVHQVTYRSAAPHQRARPRRAGNIYTRTRVDKNEVG